jgi:hypothetical protein
MAEHEPSPSNPERLLQLKDGILERWQQLPPEHQASMVLVLFQQTLEGEYGPWLQSAVKVMGPRESQEPFRFLPVVRVSRSHLAQANLTEEEIARLDEEDLRHISYEIVRHYTNDVFWEELEFVARLTLAEKGRG